MTYEEFRQGMNGYRQGLIEEAMMAKEMNLVWMNLENLYHRYDEDERKLADRVICEWLQSDDSSVRGDAEYLINRCHIRTAKDGLEKLVNHLTNIVSSSVVVRHELEKVYSILEKIGADVPE